MTSPPTVQPAPGAAGHPAQRDGFHVHLDNFEGPFDLLLSLIAAHRLDITEVALAVVTDDFLAHIRRHPEWDLDQASEFLVVAATLLDLKAARLLPTGEVEDPEDIALLEARDLLFARLLQYRAFKQVAAQLAERLQTVGRRRPRTAGVDPHLTDLLPELVLTLTPDQLALLAARAMTPRPVPEVSLTHLHAPPVSVAEEGERILTRLRRQRACTFRELVADAQSTLIMVARFLALLELYRQLVVSFEQVQALGDLTVRWTGQESAAAGSEFDRPAAGSTPDPAEETDEP